MVVHPVRAVGFGPLLAGLRERVEAGLVYEVAGPDGLVLFNYAPRCQYQGAWDDFTVLARGLVLHPETKAVVATPFPKFFNLGERSQTWPDLPFEAFAKLDGSLIVLYHWRGGWRCNTRGSFTSSQARWAQTFIRHRDLSGLVPGTTYLLEACYPENRIVVRYDKSDLVVLAAYAEDGKELGYEDVFAASLRPGFGCATRYNFRHVSDMLDRAKTLPATEEGWVVRFADGTRLKVKGDKYREMHRLVSGLTPLGVWETWAAGGDLTAQRQLLPEEFWGDFDAVLDALNRAAAGLVAEVSATVPGPDRATDKEVGLVLDTLPKRVRPLAFLYRKFLVGGGSRFLAAVRQAVRPTGNVLPGYTPSAAMHRVHEEAT